MSRRIHIRVHGRLDAASRIQQGTMTIDVGAGLISVRPLRRHRTYELPLEHIASYIVRKVIMTELALKKAAKKARRKAA